MATKQRWITAQRAAEILTANTDHEVSADYVRMLAKSGKIDYRAKDGRTNEYSESSVRGYQVRPKNTPRIRPRPSTRKDAAQGASEEQGKIEAVA